MQGAPVYGVETILGRRDDTPLEICARQLIELTSSVDPMKPLTLGLGLSPSVMSPEVVRAIVQAVKDHFVNPAAPGVNL
jgi:hypothetical protein